MLLEFFVNTKINNEKHKQKFEDSHEYKQLLEDSRYKSLSEENKQFLKENYSDLRKFKKEKHKDAKNILKLYKQKYDKSIFFHIKNIDPFVNAVFVKYGWAITVHKAIGSNYKEIIIKGHRKENDGITNSSYFRWLYSGISSGNIVNITSPKIIDPFMDCVFEDNSKIGVKTKSKELLIFENYEVESHFADKVKLLKNENVIGTICEISKLMEQSGYILKNSKAFSEYLTKVFYSIPQNENQQLILNIDNKGSKNNFAVGNIRIETLNGADENIIKECIERCLTQKKSVNSITDNKPKLPTDFREEIYFTWFESCKNSDIILKIIQSHNNQDVFRATFKSESLIFRVWYGTSEQNHTKGFFSKIEVLEKSSETILERIKELIYGH